MKIDVKHLAELAGLRIEDDRLDQFEKDMESIIAMVEQLPQPKSCSITASDNPMKLRADIACGTEYTRDELLGNAPETHAGCVVVPRTVE